ncbi:MAG: ArnT family glycosyltransferase, partial [Candidatus Rokuibacteriota bacterium]
MSTTLHDPRPDVRPRARSAVAIPGAAAWALVLFALAVSVRVAALGLPALAESNYEEAEAGLMTRHLLQSEFVAIWWGQPYPGTLHIYLAAPLFWLLSPTTVVLRLAPLGLSLVATLVSYLFARDLFGPRWALLTLGWWVVPPAFLTRLSLTPYTYIGSVAWGTVVLYLTHRVVSRGAPRKPGWFLIGFFSGLALWDHLISLCYVATAALWLALDRFREARRPLRAGWVRRLVAQPVWGLGLAGVFVGSAPLWSWNAMHRFETFTEMVQPGVASGHAILGHLELIFGDFAIDILGRAKHFWIDLSGERVLTALILLVYGPMLAYYLSHFATRAWRSWREAARPVGGSPPGLALVFVSFLLACAQVVFSSYEKALYLMPLYSSVPLLLTGYARALSRASRWLVVLVSAGVLAIHAADTAKLYQASHSVRHNPRPVDAAINFLDRQAIRHVYAHHR